MFTNLIESDSHRKEFKRRSSFFLATIAAYVVILFVAGIASIYTYDARLESLSTDITLLSWVPPLPTERPPVRPPRPTPASNNMDRTSSRPTRPILYESPSNPLTPPERVSADPNPIPPAPPNTIIGSRVADPPIPSGLTPCETCPAIGTPAAVNVPETIKPPEPPVAKPKTEMLPTRLLASRAISLPQPPYPPLAKQIHVEGAVPVQILVDEVGRVISAHAVSGHAFLTKSAEEAALRARFTPTILNGQAVKVQGVITYNFRLQ